MSELDDFLTETLARQVEAEKALHNGDPTLRMQMWSRQDPVTLFGAVKSNSGWDEVSQVFRWLASRFSDCTAYRFELVAAGVSGDLAYTVGYEHTAVSIDGVPVEPYSLRVAPHQQVLLTLAKYTAEFFLIAIGAFCLTQCDVKTLTAETSWPTFAELRRLPLVRSFEQPWLFGAVKAAGRLSQQALQVEPLASLAQQMVAYAMAFVRRGQELGFLRRDLPDDLLFDLIAALDQSSDTWLLARL